MSVLTVTTTNDVVNGGDGVTSLREAVAAAGNGDTIVFDHSLSGVFNLNSPLVFNGNARVTVDGSGFAINQNFGALLTGQVVVEGGAHVTLESLSIFLTTLGADGPNDPIAGDFGVNGTDGLSGPLGSNTPGTKGTDGGGGGDATIASGVPLPVGPALTNNGTLTLKYVEMSASMTGGDGGDGNKGGPGGEGGSGGYGAGTGNGADGGSGGDGGSGSNGLNGASVVGAILNTGKLTLMDTQLRDIHVTAGDGGDAGPGGEGGFSGNGGGGGGGDQKGQNPGNGANGGDGGNGGNGGDGGDGGDAVAALLNQGTVNVIGAAIVFRSDAEAGKGGLAGEGGIGRPGGVGGLGGGPGAITGLDGSDGSDGLVGADGKDGVAAIVSGDGTTSGKISMAVHYFEFNPHATPLTGVTLFNGKPDGRLDFGFGVEKFGDGFTAGDVGWKLTPHAGLTSNDFVGGHLYGRVDVPDDKAGFVITLKGVAEIAHDTQFDVSLRAPSGGDVLGFNKSLTVDLFRVTNGADQVIGADGHDELSGFGGADRLVGKGGYDFIYGGNGADTVLGGSGDDQLYGNSGADHLNGGTGVDYLNGGYGNDILNGAAGDDTLVGAGGNDTLNGGYGDDTLVGSGGGDRQIGGMGADQFVFYSQNDSSAAARDVIVDFHRAQGDWMNLAFDADTNTAGLQNFADAGSFIGQQAFTGVAGQVRYHYVHQADVTRVFADTNGDGSADFSFDIAGKHILHVTDFWDHVA